MKGEIKMNINDRWLKGIVILITLICVGLGLACGVKRTVRSDLTAESTPSYDFDDLLRIKGKISYDGYINIEDLERTFNLYLPYNDRQDFLSELIEKDSLPFKAMFYIALERADYDKAELTRRSWVYYLTKISNILPDASAVKQKADYQIEKLTSVVGLTDPILVKLRKELVIALEEKKWDDGQKIQNIISGRVKELRPEPVVVHERTSSGKTVVVVKQPSEQHVKVEHVPRYGAEDVGRAISLIEGKGGRLTDKEAGALKMFDILMGR